MIIVMGRLFRLADDVIVSKPAPHSNGAISLKKGTIGFIIDVSKERSDCVMTTSLVYGQIVQMIVYDDEVI